MRSFNPAFAALLAAKDKRPRFVLQVSFSAAAANDVYIKSHGDIDLTHELTAYNYAFTNSNNGWTANVGTLTTHATYSTFASSGTADYMYSPTISVAGTTYRKVRARVRRLNSIGTWMGDCYYQTSGHGYDFAYYKRVADTTILDQWVTLEWDMAALTAGGNDWITNTITAIAFRFDNDTAKSFDIDWADIGGEPTVLAARTQKISVLSQQLFPDDGRSTIGAFSFDALDVTQSLTTRQRDQLLNDNRGLRNKTVKLWVGFAELDFDDFEIYATQIIYGQKYARNVYSFTCNDVQREARKKIFVQVKLALAQPIDAVATTIPINGNTSLIVPLAHDAAFTDAPSSTVAYVKIDDEIIRIPTAGIVANQFTTVTRGVLGTRAEAHDTETGDVVADEQKAVEEVVYLEMNAVKLAYAILTGDLLNQATSMPDGWHAGVDTALIDSASFTNIGADLYDGTATGGIILRFVGTADEDAKAFVEKQICRVIGCYMPVRADGRLALRRLERVIHGAAPITSLTDRQLIGGVALDYGMARIYNRIEVAWNAIDDEPSRFTRIDDQESIDRWQASDLKVIEAFGLHGSRHSADAVRQLFERFRDRYSGPPVTTSVNIRLADAALEVGDIVNVTTGSARDYTDERTSGTLNRAFEVQGTTLDWMNGSLKLQLFGSTQAAGPLPRAITSQAIPDAWYDDLGTDLDTLTGVNGPSPFHMTANLTLNGGADINASGSIWYILGDLVIDNGVTLTITGNVQLRVRGVLTVNGNINGIEGGLAGIADTLVATDWPYFDPNDRTPWTGVTCQTGTAAYYGSPRAGGGLYERTRIESVGGQTFVDLQSFAAPATEGVVNIVPTYQIGWNGSIVTGLPSDLRGSSGGPGGKRHWSNTQGGNVQNINAGGTGGKGGAGLLVISRGMAFGASGFVNLSGGDGTIGGYNAGDYVPGHAGAGAGGAPGAMIVVVDGVLNPLPVLKDSTFIANYGTTPDPATPSPGFADMRSAWTSGKIAMPGSERPEKARSYFRATTSGLKAGVAAARALFLSLAQDNGEDPPLPPDFIPGTIQNPGFEYGWLGWSQSNADKWAVVYDPSNAHTGSFVLKTNFTGLGGSTIRNVAEVPIAPGVPVTWGFWYKTDGSWNGTVAGWAQYLNSSGSVINTSKLTVPNVVNTTYTRLFKESEIAPPGTVSVRIAIEIKGGITAGILYTDDCFMVPYTPPLVAGGKNATTTLNSTTTLTDDPRLAAWDLLAASQYFVDGALLISSGATPDFKFALQFSNAPVSAVGFIHGVDGGGAQVLAYVADMTVAQVIPGGATTAAVRFSAWITTHATLDAIMDFQWAQNTSDAGNTSLLIGSTITVTKLPG